MLTGGSRDGRRKAGKEKNMKITKKNGNITAYDDQKVVRSILNANAGTPLENISQTVAEALADDVFSQLTEKSEIITTREIRNCVYETLLDRGYPETAKRYMEYKD